jgi:sigma-54 dependent transcriptional regulator, acetoin dehydrogenase operon transcriptional activator AcoR
MKALQIGMLFSLTGTTSVIEKGQYQAALFALEEYQQKKNKNDIQFEFVIRDIRSDPNECVRRAYELAQSGIRIFIGCYTSACRKAILPVLEQYDCLLVYPTVYEGQELHPHVLYIGEIPNQQVYTMLQYMVQQFGRRVYLIGTDYIYPRSTNQQVHQFMIDLQGEVAGELYVPLGHTQFVQILENIITAQPDTILSTLVGESTIHFYRTFHEMGLKPEELPIFSPITSEVEIKAMGARYAAGHYSCASYFQSIQTEENKRFVDGFRSLFGQDTVISSSMANAYIGVQMILQAISQIKATKRQKILQSLYGKKIKTPSGMIQVNSNNHISRQVRIARANINGQFTILWDSDQSIPAKPLVTDTIQFNATESNSWKAVVEVWGQETKDAVVILDEDNLVLYANDQSIATLGIQVGETANLSTFQEMTDTYSVVDQTIGLYPAYRFILLREKSHDIKNIEPHHETMFQFNTIRTKNELYQKELHVAKIASQSDANVLILGETGSGKEVLARAIHEQSSRRLGPFVAINAGAIPRELIASELFGYIEGAFTGSRKGGAIGKFEAAHKGTLFLDEIGEMPLDLQVNLLRVLEERKVVRIGDHKERHVDVRIIAATNRNLREEIAYQGSFRSDLYYRLNVFTITIPPLRQRTEDIHHLALEFLQQFHQYYGKGPTSVSPLALQALKNYSWPGNIRELRNVMERAFLLAIEEKEVSVHHLPGEFHRSNAALPTSKPTLKDMERLTIEQVILESSSISEAAKKLGITRSTLYRKMNQWGIPRNIKK